jgi:hypothetical protein
MNETNLFGMSPAAAEFHDRLAARAQDLRKRLITVGARSLLAQLDECTREYERELVLDGRPLMITYGRQLQEIEAAAPQPRPQHVLDAERLQEQKFQRDQNDIKIRDERAALDERRRRLQDTPKQFR